MTWGRSKSVNSAGLENPETDLRVGVGMNRTGLCITFAEGMVASGKYEEDEKSRQYEADCSTDHHLYNIPLHTSLHQRICRLILKEVTDFSERMHIPVRNCHMAKTIVNSRTNHYLVKQ